MDRIRNKCIRETAQVEMFKAKVRKGRLGLFGHVQRWVRGDTGLKMLNMGPPQRR